MLKCISFFATSILLSAAVRSDISSNEATADAFRTLEEDKELPDALQHLLPCKRCRGTLPSNTYTVSTKQTKSGKPTTDDCTPDFPVRWSNCFWPSSADYKTVSMGEFFDISKAAPGGYLKGLRDMSAEMKAQELKNGVEILTDLDDTLICSGGRFPKGIDKSCTGGTFYPGAAEFYHGLSMPKHKGWKRGQPARRPIPFSARPAPSKSMAAIHQCSGLDLHFRSRICGCSGVDACKHHKCECYGLDTVRAQYGNVFDGRDVFIGATDNMLHLGYRKFKNYLELRRTFDAPIVFIGDNGQGDLSAAQMMLVASQDAWINTSFGFRGKVIAAFIHDVAKTCVVAECRTSWARHNIFFFDSYLDAAYVANTNGLLTTDSYTQVAAACPKKSSSNPLMVSPLILVILILSFAV